MDDSQKEAGAAPPFFTHNTPPPIVVGDGSLTIEAENEIAIPSAPMGGRWLHTGSTESPIAHLRVLHGSGRMEHEDLEAEGSVIKIDLEDDRRRPAGDLQITGSTTAVPGSTFQIDGDKKLLREGAGRRKRKHRYGHPGQGREFRVSSITITKPATPRKEIKAETDECQEYRILIWTVGHDHEHS